MDPSGKKPSPPRLFVTSNIEPRDDLEDRHDRCFHLVTSLTQDKGEKEANDALAQAVSKQDPKAHEDICVGLIVGILGDPEQAPRHYRDLTLVARDGLQAACNHITSLVLEKYQKMYMPCRAQLLWLTREMIKSSVNSMENICWNLMRQIAGGDVTRSNLWLADHLLDIFVEHRTWLEKFPFLLASVVYTYLRIIEDHFHVPLLLEKEVKFVVSLVRERFNDVTVIGRDLLRVLQYVAKIPEFEQLWMDIIYHPKSLSPTFTGITQLMHTRTSRRFLQSRITPEMEKKLVFLTSQVRFGTHKRYQDWFQRQYLSTSESQSLRCDLIRFIVGVIHPTNELLGSDIIPRWAIIGWLLTTCTNQVASSNAKLALFYDWLFFTPDKDNIMNIEPAILVMHHSMRPHPAITATLLDFLCRIITNFLPREKEKVHAGISNSLRTILDKRVLPSLLPLFDNQRLDEELRTMLRERFPNFVAKEGEDIPPPQLDREDDQPMLIPEPAPGENAPRFSDDEEEEEEDEDEKSVFVNSSDSKASKDNASKRKKARERRESDNGAEEQLDEDIKQMLKELKEESDMEQKCNTVHMIVNYAVQEQYEFEQCSSLASQLADVLQEEFEGKMFPEEAEVTSEAVEDSIGRPIFVVFRDLCESTDNSDSQRATILQLLAELYTLQPRIGYYLLYFLSADQRLARTAKEKAGIYKDLCEAIDEKFSLDICLVNDMRQCQEDDVSLFVFLVPEIFTNFPKHSVGNTDLLYLVVSCVDGRQVQTLVCHVVAKDFIMFKKDSFQNVLNSSLTWETFEQYALWQLAGAHDLPIDCVVPLVPKLSHSKHSEALTAVLLLLKQEKPTQDLLKSLMARNVEEGDRFVSSSLMYWMSEFEERLGDLVSNHLVRQASQGVGKRKRNQHGKSGNSTLSHSAELTLSHLDQLRRNCRQYEFFNQRSLQQALLSARNSCTETQKKKFMDLFALADSDSEDEEPSSNKNSKKSGSSSNKGQSANSSGGKSPGKSKQQRGSGKSASAATIVVSDSSEESTEESETENSKQASSRNSKGGRGRNNASSNKRKRANKVSSYKISSEESSEDEEVTIKKAPKKKKKVSHSDSD